MHWSYGRGRIGPTEDTLETDWNEFVNFSQDATHLTRSPANKHDHFWVAPMMPRAGVASRKIDDVAAMGGWFALDLDLLSCPLDTIRFRLYGTAFVGYTTANSRCDAQRWRVFVLLSRVYTVAEHARLWRWFSHKFSGFIDTKCGNPNRIFYLPAQWEDADNVWHCQYGRPIDVDSILAMVPEVTVETPVYHGDLKPAPDGTALITRHMIEQAQRSPEGGRLYRVMAQAASRYRVQGWALAAEDLAHAALAVNQVISPGKKRPQIAREAQRALQWAERHCRPQTPLEKIRSRILWEQRTK